MFFCDLLSNSECKFTNFDNKKVKVLLLDNFDSFTYNIAHYLESCDVVVDVIDNEQVDLNMLNDYDALVLSPGPGLPIQAGKLMDVINLGMASNLPILGICLGMQAIALHFNDHLFNQQLVKHGVAELITQTSAKSALFQGLPEQFEVGLYHSWAVDVQDDSPLIVTSLSETNIVMSLEHQSAPIYGVQFHPESIMTPDGRTIIENFLKLV